MRCQFRCFRAVGAADELKATVPMVAQDRWTRDSVQPVKWFLFYRISHGARLIVCRVREAGVGQMTQKSKRGHVGGGGEMMGWMRRWGVGWQGNRPGFGKGGRVKWRPSRVCVGVAAFQSTPGCSGTANKSAAECRPINAWHESGRVQKTW